MARNRAVALVGAVLVVLVALPSLTWGNASGFLGEARGNENQLTEGFVSLAPSQGSWNGTVVATIPVGNGPIGVGNSGGNRYVYVTNYESNSVSVIDRTTVVATIHVGIHPAGVGYDGGNGYVYVANQGSNNVSVINQTTVVATVPVGNNPPGVVYDSENGFVYVSNEGPNTVSVIDGTTVVATVPVGNSPFGVGYDSSGDGNVYVANL